jgi:hypothetical protein
VCKKIKSVDEFGKRAASKDGLAARCKSCQSIYDKARASDPKRVKARHDYTKTEQGKEAGSRAKRKWAASNPIKRGANIIVGNALRDGTIKKQDYCDDCKTVPVRLHGHHDDYAFPLVVRWLCPGCHNKWHKINGEGLNAH